MHYVADPKVAFMRSPHECNPCRQRLKTEGIEIGRPRAIFALVERQRNRQPGWADGVKGQGKVWEEESRGSGSNGGMWEIESEGFGKNGQESTACH